MNIQMKKVTCFILLLTCAVHVTAQTDTLKKYSNGNILLQQQKKLRLMSPEGAELARWSSSGQYMKQWGKPLNVAERNDSTGSLRYGVVDEQRGEIVVPITYNSISEYNFKKGLYMLRLGKKYGLYAVPSGKLIPAEFSYVSRHINPDWQILCSATCGYVYDAQLDLLDSIPGMTGVGLWIRHGKKEWMEVKLTDCSGLLDAQNKLIFNKEWTHIYAVRGRSAIVQSKKGIGQFDLLTGKMTMPYGPYTYEDDGSVDGRIILLGKPKSILLDSLGKPSLYFAAEDIEFSLLYEIGGFYFKQNGLWGLMNFKGKRIQEPVWETVSTNSFSTFNARFPDKTTRYYICEHKQVNGQELLTGLRQLSADEITVAYPDQAMLVQDESKQVVEMTNLPDAPAPSREEEENKIYLKMEVDPRFSSSEENEKPELRQRIDSYKKEHKIKKTGTVVVKLVVERDGKISSTTIVSSADPLLTEATKKLLATITGWKAGIQNGRVVRGEKTLTFEW